MSKVLIRYNPYKVETEIFLDEERVDNEKSTSLIYVTGKRLQEWIEPKGQWKGIFYEIRKLCNEETVEVDFYGTAFDFEDMEYAKEKYGSEVFESITLNHINKERDTDAMEKIEQIKALYDELQRGPVEELKSDYIKQAFENAIHSDFSIVVVAPFSSGKSTLINAILGKDLLPAVNQATTAVITKIRDNDQMQEFTVSCCDKRGEVICQGEPATKELIKELNERKDPEDAAGKEALIREMLIEGPIRSLPSDKLNTVFVDTPGGNNAQNLEHEQLMDAAIDDENKCLILCVINAQSPTTNDAAGLMEKIAAAMKHSENGKLSRDRFLFVINKFDAVDAEEEDYEEYIKTSILPELEKYGIFEPNLFLTAAQATKLIRIRQSGEAFSTRKEAREARSYLDLYCEDGDLYGLAKYASLTRARKDKLQAEIEALQQKGADEQAQLRIAEINSGVPSVEEAIKHYLEKYALAIKIKVAHDSFMRKVTEIDMKNKCEQQWASSQEEYESIRKELEEKQKKYEKTVGIRKVTEKIDSIALDEESIYEKEVNITKRITRLGKQEKRIKKDEADTIINQLIADIQNEAAKAAQEMEQYLNEQVVQSCNDILKGYIKHIKELDDDGIFRVGKLQLEKIAEMPELYVDSVDALLRDERYLEKTEQTRTVYFEKRGFFNRIKRWFHRDSGWGSREETYEVEYINVKKLIQDQIGELTGAFHAELVARVSQINREIEAFKSRVKQRIRTIDGIIQETYAQVDRTTKDKQQLQEQVARKEEVYRWVTAFIEKVDNILEV